ncbi:DUF2480 family protein [Joostella atrarenae]|uniref:DUF2480 family protein n=1 Tax=Joostella atrarenae TaxID=679257 RepID=A0ABS9IZU4_9FLAO|nr:DUF2480 family protein [Joostella atrarenae]MCF8713709.1 DUF2480 family protein [Joostella atrarenae]
MQEEIINRVAQSKLETFNLEDYYPAGERVLFDIKDWLLEGFLLKEKDFRELAKNYNWEQYEGSYVALTCSTEAIIPAWAFMLLTTYLAPYAKKVVVGSLEQLETSIYQDVIPNIDLLEYTDKPVIVKGCSRKPVPQNAYIMITERLIPVAKSVMYGEACSAVPLYKRK